MTDLSRASGRTVLALATAACRAALNDAGLDAGDVDAVLTYNLGDSAAPGPVAEALGVGELAWMNEIRGGGTQAASICADAAMLIDAGIATTVLIYRALNGRSGERMGQVSTNDIDTSQFTRPYGLLGPVHTFALAARRWMYETGSTQDDLAAVVLQARELATGNPRALLREPLDIDGYLSSPLIASPLRRADCCLETDGAAALVITRADRARPGSPRIHTALRGGGPGITSLAHAESLATLYSRYLAPALWEAAGMSPADIELAIVYDAYSSVVLQQLEDFGFCARGSAGDFVRSGATRPNGSLPMNPHGGLLAEGYVHGLNNVAEAVRQLRGDAVGHQVRGPGVALCTGFGGSYGSALVLTAG